MHARTFLCREALWQTFEDIAREQGAPIDEVLSEAMRSYARQRSHGVEDEPRAHDYEAENAPDLARTGALKPPTQRMNGPSAAGMAPPGRNYPIPPGIGGPPQSRTMGMGMPLPPPPPRGQGARPGPAPYTAPQPVGPPSRRDVPRAPPMGPPPSVRPPPPPMGRQAPPPQQRGGYAAPSPQRRPSETRLSLSYEGRHLDVTKDRFVLGRSKTQADLVLEDPNVSRQHAAIERMGSEWILVDLGSTNGCYVDGQRVSRRPIADGDIIEITTHQVHCTLR